MAEQTETLKVGDPAPEIALKGTGKIDFKLSEQRGKPVVLNFFPAAFSPVCANQMTNIQSAKAQFGDDAVVVGVSVDGTWALEAFAREREIDFPLLSDYYPHGSVAKEYGILYPNGASHRAVIGIDRDGVIRYIDDHAPLEVPDLEACAIALRS
ncbi:MAG: redoxin domain-containing protein [Gammaproteobacteria bacterium]